MRSSSPAETSPSKSPFRSASSKRLVSKVYGRRANVGTSSNKRARLSGTPESDSSLSSVKHDSTQGEERLRGTVILGELESDSDEVDKRDGVDVSGIEEDEVVAGKRARGGAKPPVSRTAGGKVQVDPGGKKAKRGSGVLPPKQDVTESVDKPELIPYPKASTSRPNLTKRKKAELGRADTELNIPSASEIPSPSTFPPITIQPATSSPSIAASSQNPPPRRSPEPPSTPPQKRTKRHGPLTPQSSPRDLSALFAPVSPAKSPGLLRTASYGMGEGGLGKKGGGGLFRKMLDKTQSLGAIPSPAKSNQGEEGYFDGFVTSHSPIAGPSSALSRTHSLPATPSKSSPKEPKEESAQPAQSLIVPHASSSRVDATLPTSGGRGKRTYGRSRTILPEVNDSPKSGISTPGKDKDVIKESYADLRKQFEVDNTGGDDVGSGKLTVDLLAVRGGQSVSDLRSKGENRRFMDELGYLVDPILDSATSTGLKRSSIHDILRSMQDEEWLQRAKICGQVERIWEAIHAARGSKGDENIDAMCLLYLVNLVKSGSGLDSILRSHDEECETLFIGLLKIRDGPLDEACRIKSTGLIVKLRTMYQQLDMGWSMNSMSTRRLASFLLLEITSPAVRATSTSSSLLSNEKALQRIAKSLATDVMALAGRFDLVEKGLPLLPEDRKSEADVDHISQCLTLLSNLIGHSLSDRQALADLHESAAPIVVNALIAGIYLALNGEDGALAIGSNITIQSLQILAALSNMSPGWVQAIHQTPGGLTSLARVLLHRSSLVPKLSRTRSTEPQIDNIPSSESVDEVAQFFSSPAKATSSQEQDGIGAEDVLCLVLVIVTALILGSEATTSAAASLRIDASCTGAKACLRICKCSDSALFAAHLVDTYIEHKKSKAAAASLIAAYIALILTKLILAQPDLLDLLPGSNAKTRTDGLIEVLSDLKGLQSFLHTRLRVAAAGQGAGEEEVMEGDDGVVEGAMDDLRRLAEKLEG